MQERNYWDRLQRQRISRRRLLGSTAAAGVGTAGLYLVGCGGGDDGPSNTVATPTSQAQNTLVGSRGGIYRNFSFDALALDTFDPHLTQFGPIYNMHSAVFSKVLQYDDEIGGVMNTDLAETLPEVPEGTELTIKIRPNVTFHDTPSIRQRFPEVAGRTLTSEDIQFSIERQVSSTSPQKDLFYRRFQWETIERIERPDDTTITFILKKPIASFLHYLADRNSFIVPKEVIDDTDQMAEDTRMVGSGPFLLDEFGAVQFVKVRRNPNWFAKDLRPDLGTGRPFLDGYDALWTPQDDTAQEQALLRRAVDSTGFTDDNNTLRIQNDEPGLVLGEIGTSGTVGVRLLVDRPPWNDVRLRRALHLILDRSVLGGRMFPSAPGRVGFRPSGPVGWPMERWALPPSELDTLPGYRFTQAERAQDIADGKALWEAAQGPSALEALGADIPGYIPDEGTPELVQEIQQQLGATLNITTTPYTDLAACFLRNQQDAAEGTCLFTFGFDNGWIDLDDWLYPFFHTGGSKNSFRLEDATLDAMLDAQREEFDFAARQQKGYEIQRYLLQEANDSMGVLAAVPLVNLITRTLEWAYVKNPFNQTWFGMNYLRANVWLDQTDPTYGNRKD